jgi:glutaminyl-tRNA synthetase
MRNEDRNPYSLKVGTEAIELSLVNGLPGQNFQLELHGYFVADGVDHKAGQPVFNLAVGLKDSFK